MFIEEPDRNSEKEFGLSMNTESRKVRLNLTQQPDCNFYVYDDNYGTDEEKYLVKLIYDKREELNVKYKEVYLIRNQKIMELFDKKGRRFEPDFLLFLGNGEKKSVYYQLFIEPKGKHIEDGDRWKEDFLLKLSSEQELSTLFENDKYLIYGLPFFQEKNKLEFQDSFEKIIYDN